MSLIILYLYVLDSAPSVTSWVISSGQAHPRAKDSARSPNQLMSTHHLDVNLIRFNGFEIFKSFWVRAF